VHAEERGRDGQQAAMVTRAAPRMKDSPHAEQAEHADDHGAAVPASSTERPA
jgi:hypothetical protein